MSERVRSRSPRRHADVDRGVSATTVAQLDRITSLSGWYDGECSECFGRGTVIQGWGPHRDNSYCEKCWTAFLQEEDDELLCCAFQVIKLDAEDWNAQEPKSVNC